MNDADTYGRYDGSYGTTCIEAIRSALTPEEFRGFCKGNAIKYIWREADKGRNVDLFKAEDYLNMERTGKWLHGDGE